MAEWIYFIHPPGDDFAATMTDEEQAVWGVHFEQLQRLLREGVLILAGPTLGNINTGIAVFEAPDEGEARRIMNEDPVIAGGYARGELRPYRASLLRGRDEGKLSGRAKDRERHFVGLLLEGHLERHAHTQLIEVDAHDARHHPGTFVEIDDGRGVRHLVGERREVVGVHDRPGVERRFAGRFLPGHVLRPAVRTERAWIEVRLAAISAALDQQLAVACCFPPWLCALIDRGQVEAGSGGAC